LWIEAAPTTTPGNKIGASGEDKKTGDDKKSGEEVAATDEPETSEAPETSEKPEKDDKTTKASTGVVETTTHSVSETDAPKASTTPGRVTVRTTRGKFLVV
jgi:hypothetical protein